MEGQVISAYMRDQYFGKGLYKRATPEETQIWREMRTEAGVESAKYGALALGANYVVTYPLKSTKIRIIRLPLHFFAFMTGFFYGTNKAAETGLVRFLALRDSPNAESGREWIKKNDPNNRILKKAESIMAGPITTGTLRAQQSNLGNSAPAKLGGGSTGAVLPSSVQAKDNFEAFASEPIEENFVLVAPGTALDSKTAKQNNNDSTKASARPFESVQKPFESASNFGANYNQEKGFDRRPSGAWQDTSKRDPKLDENSTNFRGEDAFALDWDEQDRQQSKEKNSGGKSSKDGRTWEEIRAEWLQRKSSQGQSDQNPPGPRKY